MLELLTERFKLGRLTFRINFLLANYLFIINANGFSNDTIKTTISP